MIVRNKKATFSLETSAIAIKAEHEKYKILITREKPVTLFLCKCKIGIKFSLVLQSFGLHHGKTCFLHMLKKGADLISPFAFAT